MLHVIYIRVKIVILNIYKNIVKSIRGVQIIIIQISYPNIISKSIKNIQSLRPESHIPDFMYHILFWNMIFKSIDSVEIIKKIYSQSLLIFLGQKLHPYVILIIFSLIAVVDLVPSSVWGCLKRFLVILEYLDRGVNLTRAIV